MNQTDETCCCQRCQSDAPSLISGKIKDEEKSGNFVLHHIEQQKCQGEL